MNDQKVDLLIEPGNPGWFAGPPERVSAHTVRARVLEGMTQHRTITSVRRALPYYQANSQRNGQPNYVHQVRSMTMHIMHDSHDSTWATWASPQTPILSARLWCGSQGSQTRGSLYGAPPEGAPTCATCEGRARANGWPSKAIVTLRPLAFRPREEQ